MHQSFAVEGGRWYEAAGRLRPGSNAGLARIRVAWYASEDGSGPQLATADSDELSGSSDLLAAVSTGRIRAPDDARSAQLRIMLRPAGEAPAVLHADDVSFARTAPPPAPTTPLQTPGAPSAAPEAAPTFFAALTNGDFELPGEAPYGWRAHAGAALVATEGGSRAAALISRGRATAWLHQSFAVEGGRWYEAGGRLRAGLNAGLARIRIAWYASEDASGAQLSTTDSDELSGVSDGFASVTTGAIRAPEDARSAELRIMLQPAGEAPALLHADEIAFARTAPPPAPTEAPVVAPSPAPEAAPAFFASLTNGDFELPGDTPYGWRAHAGAALVTTEGGSRAIALTSAGGSTAWLHQSFAVEGGRWYEAHGRLRPGANADLARIRVAWYASEDASGAQLSTADSEERVGGADAFASVSSGVIRAPDDARSAQLRIMLRPAGEAPAVLRADDVSFASAAAPQPAATPAPVEATSEAPSSTPGATPSPQAAVAVAVATATLEPYDVRSASAILLRITELLPDPLQSGADAEYEWIEVGNVGMAPVSLGGLFLADNRARIALPALTLPPAGALVVAGPQAEIGDAIAMRHGRGLFNGLGNSGDRVALATADGAIIDALSYGSDDSVDQPPLTGPCARALAAAPLRRHGPADGGNRLRAALSRTHRGVRHSGGRRAGRAGRDSGGGRAGQAGRDIGSRGRGGRSRSARGALERRGAPQAARRHGGLEPHGLDRARRDRRGRPRSRRRPPRPRAAENSAARRPCHSPAPQAALATLRERACRSAVGESPTDGSERRRRRPKPARPGFRAGGGGGRVGAAPRPMLSAWVSTPEPPSRPSHASSSPRPRSRC